MHPFVHKALLAVIFNLPGFFFSEVVSGQNVSITEELKTIKTYPYSDPNPIPSFAVDAQSPVLYPYFIFDSFTDKGINKVWKLDL
jgi:hypothetical protein